MSRSVNASAAYAILAIPRMTSTTFSSEQKAPRSSLCGVRMSIGGMLDDKQIDQIKAWIEEGAKPEQAISALVLATLMVRSSSSRTR